MCAWSIPVPSIISPILPTSSKYSINIFDTFFAARMKLDRALSGIFRTSPS